MRDTMPVQGEWPLAPIYSLFKEITQLVWVHYLACRLGLTSNERELNKAAFCYVGCSICIWTGVSKACKQ